MARVLVIDDDEAIRESLAEVLQFEGYQVSTARDGCEGLTAALAMHPDLILLDLMMPRMNGWEFREAQESDPSLAGIPVIVVSAAPPRQADCLGAVTLLAKPFDLTALFESVHGVLPPA
ncbi:response regulator transcription factor [Anaeromyxobacter paludicola]|uniref:Response regulatory domain-containing protein n=1 Tax=Anaeromyxobacter paludicola TaxID=2918171 RepID=A0ABM7X7U5_9BACT|nr:response regulator [Anaeromyxobacter paludicola]BDG07877.1 hypothetical protein AMPC_09900 [Anaeromyxobacter paludicola]